MVFFRNYAGILFNEVFPNYEKTCLFEYAEGRDEKMLYSNPSQAKLAEHSAIVSEAVKRNPFWLFFDIVQSEERDSRVFFSLN